MSYRPLAHEFSGIRAHLKHEYVAFVTSSTLINSDSICLSLQNDETHLLTINHCLLLCAIALWSILECNSISRLYIVVGITGATKANG